MDFFSNNRVSNLNFKHGEQTSIGIEDNKKNISYSISPEEVVSTPIKIRTSDNLNVVDESAGKLFWSLNKKTEGLPERVESKVINFNNGYFCVVNRSRNIFYSTNLKSWEKVFTPKNSFSIANLIEFNGLLWTATRKRVKSETEESYSYEFCVYNSKHGFVWNEVASFTSEKAIEENEGNQEIRGFCIDEGNNRLVLSSGSFVITVTPSESDYNFELIETGLPATCWTLSYFDGIFVAGTNSGFYKSTDLSNGSWTKFLEQETGNCYLSCKINGFYFLGGVNLYRSDSPEGTFEEILQCPAYCPPIDIVYVNDKYFVSLNGEAIKYQGDKVLYYSTTSDRDSWEDGLDGFTNALDSAWTLSVVNGGNTLLISSSTSGLSGVNVYGTGSSKELATREYVDNISIDTTNLVTTDTEQTISGVKKFTSRPTINEHNVISDDNVATTSSFGVVKVGGKGISINNGVLQLNHPTNYSGFNYSGNEVSVNVKSTEHPANNTTAHTALEASTGKIVVLNATTSVPGGVKLATGIDDTGDISVLTASQVKEVIDGIETGNVEIPVATTETSGTVLLSAGFDTQELDTRVLTKSQVVTEFNALDRPLTLNISNKTEISAGVDYTIDLSSDLANFEKIPMIQFFDSKGNNIIISYKYNKTNKQIIVNSSVDVAIDGLTAVVYATKRPVPLS